MAVKLTTQQRELDFIDKINRLGDFKDHFVEWYDWGPVNVAGIDCLAVVMERGHDNCRELLPLLQRDKFLRLRCIDHVAKAVRALHQHNFIHGDLKLENVVDFGLYKLIDFDHAIEMGRTPPPHCTKEYCPPELGQYLRQNGAPVVTSATFDIWCLGVLVLKLFIKDGILAEFSDVENKDILDIISDPGFLFNDSIHQLRN
ncbi:Aste57867_2174 [Aphanomyces stellatus]|uniref:Aste57867_2174 protein n=1 Tax=Aphanomyces stellatus TaxID=120398 RepID=A0A485K8E8_9STRA|nr:hypothetical protein As57867_002169 [Aphanomyces stellatus]VFT79377.1 Aste57867_2174 [Aphanomyces stellatus]